MMLSLRGHEVRTAHDGLAALEAVETFRPEVVLLDIGMPSLDGYEAARRIRRQPGGKHLLLVALTGWGQDEDKWRAREAGFDHHFVKPADPQALEAFLAQKERMKDERKESRVFYFILQPSLPGPLFKRARAEESPANP